MAAEQIQPSVFSSRDTRMKGLTLNKFPLARARTPTPFNIWHPGQGSSLLPASGLWDPSSVTRGSIRGPRYTAACRYSSAHVKMWQLADITFTNGSFFPRAEKKREREGALCPHWPPLTFFSALVGAFEGKIKNRQIQKKTASALQVRDGCWGWIKSWKKELSCWRCESLSPGALVLPPN